MRLSLKIAALIGFGATLLVLCISWRSIQRDLQIVEDDIARDAHLVATSVAVAATGNNEAAMRDLVHRVGEQSPGVTVQLLTEGPYEAKVASGPYAIRAIVPIAGSSAAIEVSESLLPRDQLWERSVRSVAATTGFVMLLSLGSGLFFGRVLVGNRVTALVDKARRVARGEFDEPVEVRGTDELTMLATELNLMARQLMRARAESEREMSARIEAEIGLRHADRLRTVGQLSAGIAHELGTPLTVISGRAALLLRALEPGDVRGTHATTIRDQTDRITTMIGRLMDYSRRSPTRKVHLDLGELVAETIVLVRGTLTDVAIQSSLAPGARVFADAEQLCQVMTNLLLNAAQAAPSGHIVVSLKPVDGKACVRVEDDGPGIPPSDWERVLEPFFTTKEPGKGTGLGLSVVDGILREHGGDLEIGRAELGGAAVTVTLPLESECKS